MRYAIVGKGGREHALAWKLHRAASCEALYLLPGNPGTRELGENLQVPLARAAEVLKEKAVDLVLFGPEDPLAEGWADRFREQGLRAFGPSAEAARLEASKAFAREFCARHGLPGPQYSVFTDATEAHRFIEDHEPPLVVKASGLAGGKGSLVCRSRAEAHRAVEQLMEQRIFGEAGATVVVEEFLHGEEASVIGIVDTQLSPEPLFLFPPARDYKRRLDGNKGPNTGGMGCVAPLPGVDAKPIFTQVLNALIAEGIAYQGFLYLGLMLTAEGPRILEFNVRMGDPECQVLVPLVDGDLGAFLAAIVEGRNPEQGLHINDRKAVCVVLATESYPYASDYGTLIHLPPALPPGVLVFHAGTHRVGEFLVTHGGRILHVVGVGRSFAEARRKAYETAKAIEFRNKAFRRDIAAELLTAVS